MVEQFIESFDRTRIALNHLSKEGRDTVLIICHGFAMSKDAPPFLALCVDLFRQYDIVAMDQRGHGRSGGTFSFSAREDEDIKAVIDYSRRRYKHIYLLGFSLGAASCIIEVARNKNVEALILVSPPLSFAQVENRFLHRNALIPGLQNLGNLFFRLRMGNIFARKVRPIDVIDQISPIPLLIIHGDKDPIVFPRHARALFARAKEPKKLVLIKGGLHAEELYRKNPEDFIQRCILWIKEIGSAKISGGGADGGS